MAWLQLSVDVPGDQAEIASEAFSAAGALSVTVLDAGDEPLFEPAPGETGWQILTVYWWHCST